MNIPEIEHRLEEYEMWCRSQGSICPMQSWVSGAIKYLVGRVSELEAKTAEYYEELEHRRRFDV